jgi:hypothetical protein
MGDLAEFPSPNVGRDRAGCLARKRVRIGEQARQVPCGGSMSDLAEFPSPNVGRDRVGGRQWK